MINEPLFSDAAQIGQMVLDAYAAGEVGEIWIAYTMFKNTVVHIPILEKLLPVEAGEADGNESGKEGGAENGEPTQAKAGPQAPMNYEPEAEEALNIIIPTYINSIIYGAFIEAVASENGARMQAMDNATSNAEEMIANLSLAYNRARQGAITQELTEIISGAEALN
jgi:F-type H+-transporting ATPase subunit gamma